MNTKISLAVAAIAATQLGATDCGQAIRDPGFDLWCGDSLCTWKLLRGDIQRVGTWNEADSGVSFVDVDTAIQQTSPVSSADGNCLRFSLIADVDDAAEVTLNIDLEADGTVERQEQIPTSHWQPISFLISIDGPYDGIRFELAKTGTGRAVLANVGAQTSTGCDGLAKIAAGPRPNGAGCLDGTQCASGLCIASPTEVPGGSISGQVCAGCDPAAPACGTGQACGVGASLSPTLAEPIECIAAGSRELAEACATDAECESGKCAAGACSGCKTAADCAGNSCGPSWVTGSLHAGPSVCRPGEHAGATGAPCGTDADCASNSCAGSSRDECSDGRPCASSANCPADSDLTPGACTPFGVQGGSCT